MITHQASCGVLTTHQISAKPFSVTVDEVMLIESVSISNLTSMQDLYRNSCYPFYYIKEETKTQNNTSLTTY